MPLSRPAARNLLHLRDITLRGYERADGLVDIEARMADVKTYSFANHDRGGLAAGEPLHEMWIRLTVDRDMVIHDCEASIDASPYTYCAGAAPDMARLKGLRIGKGFLRAAMLRVGGAEGCTHLRELLQPVATVAFQTMIGVGKSTQAEVMPEPGAPGGQMDARMLNSCYAYGEKSTVVARANLVAVTDLPVPGPK